MDVALFTQEGLIMILRWIHFFAGVAWIGNLYYLNFIQGAFMTEIEAGVKNHIFAKLVPRVMLWFRYGALFTFLSGLAMLAIAGHELKSDFFQTSYGIYIYTGSLLGILMFLNVWLVIWPRQKIMIANGQTLLGGGAANPEVAKIAPEALLASRTNVMFSIPMLFFMGASRHLGLNIPEEFSATTVLLVVTLIIFALQLNALKGKLGMLTTVRGVIHCGVALLVVLYGLVEALV
jgi:uncharacterized membrane protein